MYIVSSVCLAGMNIEIEIEIGNVRAAFLANTTLVNHQLTMYSSYEHFTCAIALASRCRQKNSSVSVCLALPWQARSGY